MTEVPEDVLRKAFDLVEAMTSNKHDALTSSDARYERMLTDDANAIARVILAERAKARDDALEEAAKFIELEQLYFEGSDLPAQVYKAAAIRAMKGQAHE